MRKQRKKTFAEVKVDGDFLSLAVWLKDGFDNAPFTQKVRIQDVLRKIKTQVLAHSGTTQNPVLVLKHNRNETKIWVATRIHEKKYRVNLSFRKLCREFFEFHDVLELDEWDLCGYMKR